MARSVCGIAIQGAINRAPYRIENVNGCCRAKPIQSRKTSSSIDPVERVDYEQSGAYFVTICTQNRECILGSVTESQTRLTEAGRIVQAVWGELPSRFSNMTLDVFVVMPNHVHGIILMRAQFIAPSAAPDQNQGAMNRTPTLGEILRTYKAVSTRMIRKIANANFAWQRNYYEHVIRDEESLKRIQEICSGESSAMGHRQGKSAGHDFRAGECVEIDATSPESRLNFHRSLGLATRRRIA
jgi:putative transposase